jgi:hypothetical protein
MKLASEKLGNQFLREKYHNLEYLQPGAIHGLPGILEMLG